MKLKFHPTLKEQPILAVSYQTPRLSIGRRRWRLDLALSL
jgi:hypothetical protein